MPRRELLIEAGPGEWRAALCEDGAAVEIYLERGEGCELGSIHLGRVLRRLPALAAVLVDIGGPRPVFLPDRDLLQRGARLADGERMIVQIRREAQGGKSARATARPSLRGHSVELNLGETEALVGDASGLARRWQEIVIRAAQLEPPARLEPRAGFAAALAGAMPSPPECVVVDDPAAVAEIRAAFSGAAVRHAPEAVAAIEIDALFDQVLSPTIALAGGGAVHIEAARAAVLIDVDTGSPEGGARQEGSPERAGLAADLAAAAVIARQLRLRSLGGGIVVDFVGLDRPRSREAVREALDKVLLADPARPQILGWTRLGHLELVRARQRRPLFEALCERDADGAFVKSAATIAFAALRAVRRAARAEPGQRWRLLAAPEIAAALAGPLAGVRREIETRLGRDLAVTGEGDRRRDRFDIVAR